METIMNIKMKIILILLFAGFLLIISCEQPQEPTGFISAEDKTPPELEIISPGQNADVKGYITVTVAAKDFFGFDNIVFRTLQGNQMRSEYLWSNGDTLAYGIDLCQQSGKIDIKVEASDVSENITSKLLTLNVTPILKYEYQTPSTNAIDLYSVKDDSKGNVWLATDEGLFEYDGNALLTEIPGFSLPYPVIRTLAIDRNDVIWLNYRQKYSGDKPRLVAFDGNQIITNIEFPQTNLTASYNSFAIGENDTLFGAGIYYYFKYKDDQWTLTSEVNDNFFYYVSNDNSYKVWMGCRNDIRLLENNHWTFITPPYYTANNYFALDDSSNLWIQRTDQEYSLARYSGSEWSSFDLLPSYSEIRAFDVDKNGNIWVSSDEGLFKFSSDGVLIKKVSYFYNIFFIKADRNNNIWMNVDFGIMRLNEDGV